MEVTFSEVVGMEELNDGRPRKVKNCKVSSLRLASDCNSKCQCPPMASEKPVLAVELSSAVV